MNGKVQAIRGKNKMISFLETRQIAARMTPIIVLVPMLEFVLPVLLQQTQQTQLHLQEADPRQRMGNGIGLPNWWNRVETKLHLLPIQLPHTFLIGSMTCSNPNDEIKAVVQQNPLLVDILDTLER